MTRVRRQRRVELLPPYWSTGIDALMALVIVVLLVAIYMPQAATFVEKARHAQLFTLVAQMREHLLIEHAVHGRWPTSAPQHLVALSDGIEMKRVVLANGHFAFELSNERLDVVNELSFRRADDARIATSLWYCGYARTDAIAGVRIANITTLSAEYLPSVCRSGEAYLP